MKLVDILARDLKCWPYNIELIEQSDSGKIYDSIVDIDYWKSITVYELSEDFSSTKITRAEWQAAVDALNAPKVVEWVKGSLPPIGSVVEWDGCTFAPEEPQEKDLRVGDQVTIIAHLKDGDFEMAAFTFNPKIHNPARGSIWVNQGAYGCFRPIRNAEQVAAEEREKSIKDLYYTINWNDRPDDWSHVRDTRKADYARAIDAGYAKVAK